jgi:hypothetical protein
MIDYGTELLLANFAGAHDRVIAAAPPALVVVAGPGAAAPSAGCCRLVLLPSTKL